MPEFLFDKIFGWEYGIPRGEVVMGGEFGVEFLLSF